MKKNEGNKNNEKQIKQQKLQPPTKKIKISEKTSEKTNENNFISNYANNSLPKKTSVLLQNSITTQPSLFNIQQQQNKKRQHQQLLLQRPATNDTQPFSNR